MTIQRKRAAIAIATVLGIGAIGMTGAGAAQAEPFASNAGTLTAGVNEPTTIRTAFTNKTAASGRYVLDVEIVRNGDRIAQWFETRDVSTGETEVLDHEVSLGAGQYEIKTGTFNDNWSGMVTWNNDAGSLKVSDAPATAATNGFVRKASGSVENGKANVSATIKASRGQHLVDLELFDQNNQRVGQHYEVRDFNGGTQTITAGIDTQGRSGPFVLKVGLFDPNWQFQDWNDSASVIKTGVTSTPTTAAPVTTTTAAPVPQVEKAPTPTTAAPALPVAASGNPFSGRALYTDSNSQAATVAAQLQAQGRTADAALIKKIADTPTGIWLGGWSGDIKTAVSGIMNTAGSKGQMPTFIAYNIPNRDCGSYSAGGLSGVDAYKTWINGLAAGLGNGRAAVIVEPDALPGIDCLSAQGQADRYAMLSYAVDTLAAKPNVAVYLDGGNSTWQPANVMADRLTKANIAKARGFSLNVSGFEATGPTVAFGNDLGNRLGGKHYVVDVSRNGNGSIGEWCNPAGRKIGVQPTTNTGQSLADAYLWLKVPGESDGTCNGGPNAGEFWLDRALEMTR